ncbi:hypothetical protein A2U01_0098815, partial [Trifolium medium]|nr:hypothetical protein [Trifolium medium]
HDQEAGGSGASVRRSRSQRQQVDVDEAEDAYVNEGQYLADDADWADEEPTQAPTPQQPPHQPPPAHELQPQEGYPG